MACSVVLVANFIKPIERNIVVFTFIVFVCTYVLSIRWCRYGGCFWWEKRTDYVVNKNKDFFVFFCIKFVPWWCKHTIFLGHTNYLFMNLDYKIPKHYLIWQQHFSCVYFHVLDVILSVCARHAQSILFTIRTYSGRSGRVWPNTRRAAWETRQRRLLDGNHH